MSVELGVDCCVGQVNIVVFPNYEALPEHDHVVEPFLEASLFKRNFAHVRSDLYFKNYETIAKGNPNYFVAYGNGKSAARLEPGIRPNGAHRWYFYTKRPQYAQMRLSLVL